jgi:hypothetical protein
MLGFVVLSCKFGNFSWLLNLSTIHKIYDKTASLLVPFEPSFILATPKSTKLRTRLHYSPTKRTEKFAISSFAPARVHITLPSLS